MHVVPNKSKGGMRPTRISDARVLGLLPSVTTILKVAAKPQLDQWKERQVAKAALEYVRNPTEEITDELLDKIRENAFKQVSEAADLGTNVHAALEAHFSDLPYDPAYDLYVKAVDQKFQDEGIHVIQREITLVNKEYGFAGKADLVFDSPKGLGIGDHKVRRSKPQYAMEPYDDQSTQCAAYCKTHFGDVAGRCAFNCYISSTEPGRVEVCWYDDAKLSREWEVFKAYCTIWQNRNSYNPCQ